MCTSPELCYRKFCEVDYHEQVGLAVPAWWLSAARHMKLGLEWRELWLDRKTRLAAKEWFSGAVEALLQTSSYPE